MLANKKQKHWHSIAWLVLVVASILAYLKIGYQTPRTDFYSLLFWYVLAAGGYLVLAFKSPPSLFLKLIGLSIIFRLVLIPGVPNLSDDYFRFLWDGHLFASGINPFQYRPSEWMATLNTSTYLAELYPNLNSKEFYSVYPPVLQYLFAAANGLFPNQMLHQVIFLKSVSVLAEIGSIYFILKLLSHYKLPKTWVLWYALNPMIIIELSANLHFEVLMIFFLLLSMFLLIRQKPYLAAVALCFAFAVKLLPLLFLPFILKHLGRRRSIPFALTFVASTMLAFFPILFLRFTGQSNEFLKPLCRTF